MVIAMTTEADSRADASGDQLNQNSAPIRTMNGSGKNHPDLITGQSAGISASGTRAMPARAASRSARMNSAA